MQDFNECPYCALDLEQWTIRFHRSDLTAASGWREVSAPRIAEGPFASRSAGGRDDEGLTLLSLCPSERCGYYVLRYRTGLAHWDRDVEAARLLRTVFSEQ